MTVQEQLRGLLRRLGLRQTDLAYLVGASLRQTSAWCRGEYPVPLSVWLVLLAYADGSVSAKWLARRIKAYRESQGLAQRKKPLAQKISAQHERAQANLEKAQTVSAQAHERLAQGLLAQGLRDQAQDVLAHKAIAQGEIAQGFRAQPLLDQAQEVEAQDG
jgi:DNA-binding XRE family transcriptional regulator